MENLVRNKGVTEQTKGFFDRELILSPSHIFFVLLFLDNFLNRAWVKKVSVPSSMLSNPRLTTSSSNTMSPMDPNR